MEGKLLYALLALVASTAASSIYAGINPSKVYAGGELTFPRIPGINAPLFNFSSIFGGSQNDNSGSINGTGSTNGTASANGTSSYNYTGSPLGPFTPFLRLIPGLNLLIPKNGQSNLPGFPNIEQIISRIPGIGSGNVTIPEFHIPNPSEGPYIPGVSEALAHARQHLQAALNITSDFNTGFRNVIQVALNGENPVNGIRIILDTIAKVYSTVAANCPLIIIGSRVFSEGIRLSGEVMKSIMHIAIGI